MNWKDQILTIVVTAVVGLVTTMTIFWWQSDTVKLTYNSIKSIPFDDINNKLYIQQVEIKNSGDRTINNIVFLAHFENDSIQKSKIIIDKTIPFTEEKKYTSNKIQHILP